MSYHRQVATRVDVEQHRRIGPVFYVSNDGSRYMCDCNGCRLADKDVGE